MAEEKKKSWSGQVQDQSNAYADALQSNANQLADITAAAGQAQLENIAAAQDAQQKANQSAMELYQQRMNEGYTSFADIIGAREREMQQEQAEAERRIAADNRAARWTGLTELAASVANLVGVGGYNAVSQQYKSYSQDWMKKADQDMRENRMRMDNLRARQDALKQQLIQMKMGNAGQALQNAQRMADQAYQNALQREQLRYGNTINPAQIRTQGAEKAEAARLQGLQSAASLGMNEASLAQRRAEHAATMASKGFNPDGTVNEGYMKNVAAATRKASGSSSSSGTPIDFVVNGKHYTVNMGKEAYDTGIRRGREEIRKDVMARAGFNGDWSEFEKLATGGGLRGKEKRAARKSGDLDKYSEYADIVSALSGYGDIDPNNGVIKDYIESHKSDMNNFNIYMISVAGNAAENGLDNGPYETTTSISQDLNGGNDQTAQAAASTTGSSNQGANAKPRSIEDELWGEEPTPNENQAVASKVEETPAPTPAPAAKQSVAEAQPRRNTSGYQSGRDWDKEKISNGRFKAAYDNALKDLLTNAAKEYEKNTGEKIDYYDKNDTLNQAVAVLRRHQSGKGIDEWDDAVNSIVRGVDIAQHISEEDRNRLRQMVKDKESMSANDFAKKYNISL